MTEPIRDEIIKCPECGSRNLAVNDIRGERVCDECGLVLEENIIDPQKEWRSFEDGASGAVRGGEPESRLIHDRGRGSTFDWREKGLTGRKKSQFYRMQKWQQRARMTSSRDRNLAEAYIEIKKIGSRMNLGPSILEQAGDIYKRAATAGLVRGRSTMAIVAASIYATLKLTGNPRPLPVMAQYTRCGQKEIGRTFRIMKRELGLKIRPTQPEDYVQLFASELQIRPEVSQEVHSIIQQAKEKEFDNGRAPAAIAAAAIYIACLLKEQRRTQSEIAAACGITEVTIRGCYKEMIKLLEIKLGN